jgi:putative membrane protein
VADTGADADPARSASFLRTAGSALLGVGLLGWLLYYTGIDEILAHLRPLGASAPLILLPYFAITWCDALGWRCAFPADVAKRVPLTVFSFVRMAGEAVNGLTPTATVGGEPIKVLLLRRRGISSSEAVASLFISKTALTVAQSLLVVIGMGALFGRLERFELGAAWLIVLLLATFGFGAGLVWLQRRGPAGTLVRFINRVLPRSRMTERFAETARTIDERLDAFYRLEHHRFLRAGSWHFLGWALGITEVLLMTRLMGAPVGVLDATIIEALAQPIRATAVIIPGGLGAQEVGGTALCVFLGMTEPVAVTLWLLKRARETVFDLIGLVYFAFAARTAAQAKPARV